MRHGSNYGNNAMCKFFIVVILPALALVTCGPGSGAKNPVEKQFFALRDQNDRTILFRNSHKLGILL